MRTLCGTRIPRAAARFYPDLIWRMAPFGRKLYLTFDDGPTADGTDELLVLLGRYHIKATFFLIGRHVQQFPDAARAIALEGHTIGNHTFSHPKSWRVRPRNVADELTRATDVISETVDRPVQIMRPPFGRFTRGMRNWCSEQGQRMIMWDVLTWDFIEGIAPSKISRSMLTYSRPGSIIVLHDNRRTYRQTIDALDQTLPLLLEHGWNFGTL